MLKPEYTPGIHMRISRKALLQTRKGSEQAIRRGRAGSTSAELDKAIFSGNHPGAFMYQSPEWSGVKACKVTGEGFHALDDGEIAQFFKVHEPGTTAPRAVTPMP